MPAAPYRYQSDDEDSARWSGFPFRDDDIVISTRSKTGTTWVQMICALLIFQSAELPAPISQLSPWLDHLVEPREDVYARLAAQEHRRFIKTHTPLDGIPLDPRVTYIVTGRHPLDSAVSLYHHGDNIDKAKLRALIGAPEPDPGQLAKPRLPLHDWLLSYATGQTPPWHGDGDPRDDLDSLPGVLWHLRDAWARRSQPNVLLIHYDDLIADLEGQMRRLAALLRIDVPEGSWPALVQAATFESMRATPAQRVPNTGVLKNHAAFFRRGNSGAGREVLTDAEVASYHARVAGLAPADLLAWLHHEGTGARDDDG